MMAYRRKGRKYFEMRVPVKSGGDGPIRSMGTSDPDIRDEMVALVERLKAKRQWDLLEAVTASPPTLRLIDIYDADRVNQLDKLLESLDDPDLSQYLDEWEGWLEANLDNSRTVPIYVQQVRSLILPKGEKSPAFPKSALTVTNVSKWLTESKVSSSTRRKKLYALFSFIRFLREMAVLEGNPIESITRPKKGKKRLRWETVENDIRIVEAAPKNMQGLFAFIKATGSEVSPPLNPKFKAREIELWEKDEDGYCGLAPVPGTKNEKRDRHDIFIEAWARPYLERHLKGMHPNAPAFADMSRYMAHWHHKSAAAAADVEDYTLRDSRHSWSVRARKEGRSFEAIAAQLGNTVYQVATTYAAFKVTPAERRQKQLAATKPATQAPAEGAAVVNIRGRK